MVGATTHEDSMNARRNIKNDFAEALFICTFFASSLGQLANGRVEGSGDSNRVPLEG